MKNIFVLLFLLILIAGCNNKDSIVAPDTSRHVIYKVEGTTDMAYIGYFYSAGDSVQFSNSPVPVSIILETMHAGDHVYISGINLRNTGTLKLRILVDSVEFKSISTSNPNAVISIEGNIP